MWYYLIIPYGGILAAEGLVRDLTYLFMAFGTITFIGGLAIGIAETAFFTNRKKKEDEKTTA